MDSPLLSRVDRSVEEGRRALEKLKRIKDEIVLTIKASPSSYLFKSLVSLIFEMAVVDSNAYTLLGRLSVHLFHELPSFRYNGQVTSFERLFLRKCRMELQNSSPTTDRPPLVYVDESTCWGFIKTVRVLSHIFHNSTVSETTRHSIIQLLMQPMFPPERNVDAMNLFLSSIGKLADFHFSDESFKKQLQSSQLALELEKQRLDGEAKLRKEAEDALSRNKRDLEIMIQLLESYKEEQSKLRSQFQATEQQLQDELRLRKETEAALTVERDRMDMLKLRLESLEDEHDSMRSRAEEFERKYEAEFNLRRETEAALDRKKIELEKTMKELESRKKEEENLTSQVRTWQDKYEQESCIRKETEEAVSREKQELEIVKGLLESYNREADAMREERDNALKAVQELKENQMKEREPPQSFICRITQEIMRDPQVTADGFTYEGEAIKRWFNLGYHTSPATNLKLPHLNLVPNWALRSAIEDFV